MWVYWNPHELEQRREHADQLNYLQTSISSSLNWVHSGESGQINSISLWGFLFHCYLKSRWSLALISVSRCMEGKCKVRGDQWVFGGNPSNFPLIHTPLTKKKFSKNEEAQRLEHGLMPERRGWTHSYLSSGTNQRRMWVEVCGQWFLGKSATVLSGSQYLTSWYQGRRQAAGVNEITLNKETWLPVPRYLLWILSQPLWDRCCNLCLASSVGA